MKWVITSDGKQWSNSLEDIEVGCKKITGPNLVFFNGFKYWSPYRSDCPIAIHSDGRKEFVTKIQGAL